MQHKAIMSWLYLGLVFGMLLTLAALPAVAGHHNGMNKMAGCHEGMGGGMMCGPAWEQELNLTADQKEKIKAEQAAAEKEMIKLDAEAKALHVDLAAETGKDRPDLAVIEKLSKQIGEVKGRMILAHTKSMLQVKSLLTPDQKKKLDEMMMKCQPGMGGMRPGMEGKGMGGRCPMMEGQEKEDKRPGMGNQQPQEQKPGK